MPSRVNKQQSFFTSLTCLRNFCFDAAHSFVISKADDCYGVFMARRTAFSCPHSASYLPSGHKPSTFTTICGRVLLSVHPKWGSTWVHCTLLEIDRYFRLDYFMRLLCHLLLMADTWVNDPPFSTTLFASGPGYTEFLSCSSRCCIITCLAFLRSFLLTIYFESLVIFLTSYQVEMYIRPGSDLGLRPFIKWR